MARADARRASEDGGALVASVRVGRENKLTISTDAGPPSTKCQVLRTRRPTGLDRATLTGEETAVKRRLTALEGGDESGAAAVA
jgi:hypothetical protein